MADNNWFELAKTIELQPYLENFYEKSFKKKSSDCPFCSSKDGFMIDTKKNNYKCFSCESFGDSVEFVQKIESIDKISAVKKVLIDNNLLANENFTPKENEEFKKQRELRLKEFAVKKKIEDDELKKAKEKASKEMQILGKQFKEALMNALDAGNEKVRAELISNFPHYYKFNSFVEYVGWDWSNETICTINRDSKGSVCNIKRKKMKGFDGKWISYPKSSQYPFGLNHLWNDDNRVVICEGEKDALNLKAQGVNTLTLGGVTNRWEEHLDVLKNKEVYIWFDHDKAGYLNAFKRYMEIKEVAKNCRIVLFYKLKSSIENKYDVSDWLIDNEEMSNATQIFEKIEFSSFRPSNEILGEIEELFEWGDELKALEELRTVSTNPNIVDIEKDIIKNTKRVKHEAEVDVARFTNLEYLIGENAEVEQQFDLFISAISKTTQGDVPKNLKDLIAIKSKILIQYQQPHIYDVALEVKMASERAGYMFGEYRGTLFIWNGVYWYRFLDGEFQKFLLKQMFPAMKLVYKRQTSQMLQDTYQNVKDQSDGLERWVENAKDKRIMTLKNGVLTINKSGKTLFKKFYRKEDCAFNFIDIEFDKSATCPKWNQFLKMALPDKEDRDMLMEFFGYCLMPSHQFESFLMLHGVKGGNGKSTVLAVLAKFFGEDNISRLGLHDLYGHSLDGIANKFINIGAELEARKDLGQQLSNLKQLVSEYDGVLVDPKFDKVYTISGQAKPKMVFSTNGLPKQGVNDGGVLRRMKILDFKQTFTSREAILDLPERFTQEMGGVLNLAIEGLNRLIANRKFTMSESREAFMEEYLNDLDTTREYAKKHLIVQKGVMLPKTFIFQHYKQWCEATGNKYQLKERTFFNELKKHIDYEELRSRDARDDVYITANMPVSLTNINFNTESEVNLIHIGNKDAQHITKCAVKMK